MNNLKDTHLRDGRDRLDRVLTERGLVRSRSQARDLIKRNLVLVDGSVLSKPGEQVAWKVRIEVKSEVWVGRGAEKLVAALEGFEIDPKGWVAADVGASTGGFTEVLLRHHCSKVYALDVGRDQLAPSLREDPRVVNLEGVNIRHAYNLPELVDGAVVDLSFISLRLVLANVVSLLKEGGHLVVLIKPQFEVGPAGVNHKGIVRNPELARATVSEIMRWAKSLGLQGGHLIESPVIGKTGNREFLAHWHL